jgi:cell division GTPase FtsZ
LSKIYRGAVMLEVTNNYTIKKEEFFYILKPNQLENRVKKYDSIIELSKNIFSAKDGDINLSYNDITNIFDWDADINIVTLKVNEIKEGLKFIVDTKEIDKQKSLCFHFHLNSDFMMIDISEAMELIYDSANEEANIALCISSDENRSINEIEINCFYS